MEVQKFKISQSAYAATYKRTLIRLTIIIVVVVIVFGYYTYEPRNGADAAWIGFLTFLILVYAIILYRTLNRLKAVYDSYVITIDELGITREQLGLAPRSVQISDITTIIKSANTSFTIKGKSNAPADTIVISKLIENQEQLELLLSEIKPIVINTRPSFKEKYGSLISIIVAVPVIGVFFFDNKIIVSICATIALVFYVAAFFTVLKNKNGITKQKRRLWYIVFLLLLVLTTTYFKLIT